MPNGSPDIGGFVYVVEGDGQRVKVGVTNNPTARLAQLNTGSAHPLRFSYLGALDCPYADLFRVEAEAHALLDRHRHNGEWFEIAPEMAVGALSAAAHRAKVKMAQIDPAMADRVVMLAKASANEQPKTSKIALAIILLPPIVGAVLGGYLVYSILTGH